MLSAEQRATGEIIDAVIEAARKDERQRIVKWLRGIDRWTIDDWGLNGIGNVADLIESGEWSLLEDARATASQNESVAEGRDAT